jgi:ParB family chromosome partitioning protein
MENQIKPRFGSVPRVKINNAQPSNQLNQASNPQNKSGQVLIRCDKLIIDENQPFRLYNNEQLADLAERIKQSGLLNPITVRPRQNDRYEVLSGRNRTRAVMLNGDKEIAAFIRNVGDDEAKMIMLNANLGQRENLLPSEKAKAYAMEAEILNRNGKRPDSTLGKDCPSYDARKVIGEKHNESKRTISNYIRLVHLIPELLMYVDEKKLPLLTGVELSYLDENDQHILFESFINKGLRPNKEQLSEIRKLAEAKNFCYISLKLMFDELELNKYGKHIKLDWCKFERYKKILSRISNMNEFFLGLIEKYAQDLERSDAM